MFFAEKVAEKVYALPENYALPTLQRSCWTRSYFPRRGVCGVGGRSVMQQEESDHEQEQENNGNGDTKKEARTEDRHSSDRGRSSLCQCGGKCRQ